MPRILSVNIGRPRLQRVPRGQPTGIDKRPVDVITVADPGPQRIVDGAGVSGVDGDLVGEGRYHGGSDRAVYAFAREELDAWAQELSRELPNGVFGENLTTSGIEVDAAEIGDIWRVGTAVLEVRWPRNPCATFGAWMDEPGWVRRFAGHGRTGAHLSVRTPGEIRPGDEIIVEPSGSGIDVPTVLRARLGDAALARRVLDADCYTGHRREQMLAVAERA